MQATSAWPHLLSLGQRRSVAAGKIDLTVPGDDRVLPELALQIPSRALGAGHAVAKCNRIGCADRPLPLVESRTRRVVKLPFVVVLLAASVNRILGFRSFTFGVRDLWPAVVAVPDCLPPEKQI